MCSTTTSARLPSNTTHLRDLWPWQLLLSLLFRHDAKFTPKRNNTRRKGWVSLQRECSNSPVRKSIWWWRREPSAALQRILFLTARCSLHRSASCKAQMELLVLSYRSPYISTTFLSVHCGENVALPCKCCPTKLIRICRLLTNNRSSYKLQLQPIFKGQYFTHKNGTKFSMGLDVFNFHFYSFLSFSRFLFSFCVVQQPWRWGVTLNRLNWRLGRWDSIAFGGKLEKWGANL